MINLFDNYVQKIARITGISEKDMHEDIIRATQRAWLRPIGSERWELHRPEFERLRSKLLPLFEELGFVKTILPIHNIYNYGLILGGTVQAVISRYSFLQDLTNAGLCVQKIIVLTGQRYLTNSEQDEVKTITGIQCVTESEMMVAILKTKFEQLDSYKPVIIDAPRKLANNVWVRPNTQDTVLAWVDSGTVLPGSCLAVSNQPFIYYQDIVIRTSLPSHFNLETVGASADNNISIAVYLDTLARYLYQINIYNNLRKQV